MKTDTPLRTAMYTRVSTEGQTVEPQRIELLACATQRGLVITHELSDVISGAKTSREGLDRLMALVKAHEIDAVLIVKLDRIARSLSHFARLCDEFRKHGVALIIPGQGIDTSKNNPCGEMQLGILAVIAQFERSLIRERTKAGLVAAKARGKILGKPSKVLVPDWRERVVAWRARTGGFGLRGLRVELGGVSLSTAAKLRDEVAA